MSILTLSGSPSPGPSRSSAMLAYVAARVQAAGYAVARLAIRDVPAEDLVQVRREGEAATRLQEAVTRSAAIVVGTPIYNASIPGGLKALLDLLAPQAFHGKPVLVLASGGSAGHQLAIEYSLKPVLSALGARHVLAGVFAAEGDVSWHDGTAGKPAFLPPLVERLDDAADALLASLSAQSPLEAMPNLAAAAVTRHRRSSLSTPERCSA